MTNHCVNRWLGLGVCSPRRIDQQRVRSKGNPRTPSSNCLEVNSHLIYYSSSTAYDRSRRRSPPDHPPGDRNPESPHQPSQHHSISQRTTSPGQRKQQRVPASDGIMPGWYTRRYPEERIGEFSERRPDMQDSLPSHQGYPSHARPTAAAVHSSRHQIGEFSGRKRRADQVVRLREYYGAADTAGYVVERSEKGTVGGSYVEVHDANVQVTRDYGHVE